MWNAKPRQGESILAVKLANAVEVGLRPVVTDHNEQGLSMFYHRAGNPAVRSPGCL